MKKIRVMTLNLHGYHPMGEAIRYFQDHRGTQTIAPTDIYYFTWDEIQRGNLRRLDHLSDDIGLLLPDILFLQEVAAGSPNGEKSDRLFYDYSSDDGPHKNTALRLCDRLQERGYSAVLACRGNWGWITNPATFDKRRIVRKVGGEAQVVFDFAANPYPNAILIEGFALLYRAPWQVSESGLWQLESNQYGDHGAFQYAVLHRTDYPEKKFLAVNMHNGYKVHHLEQAIALRMQTTEFIASHRQKEQFCGIIVAGDANAGLYRPNSRKDFSEPATAVWEVFVPDQFDLRIECPQNLERFRRQLMVYCPGPANDRKQAEEQIDQALWRFGEWQQKAEQQGQCRVMQECLWVAQQQNKFHPPKGAPAPAKYRRLRIDHIYTDEHFAVENAFVLYNNADWTNLESVSDHIGVCTDLKWV